MNYLFIYLVVILLVMTLYLRRYYRRHSNDVAEFEQAVQSGLAEPPSLWVRAWMSNQSYSSGGSASSASRNARWIARSDC